MDGVGLFVIITLIVIGAGITLGIYVRRNKKSVQRNLPLQQNELKSSVANELADINNHSVSVTMSEIRELILQDDSGNQLSFQRPKYNPMATKYQEVLAEGTKAGGHIVQGALPVLGQAHTIAELQRMAPNGLFTATADKAVLSHFADGTYTTMVRDSSNHLVANAGFKEVGQLSKVNPAVALGIGMQAMAAISGQYYMTQINGQLAEMSKNLDELIDMHHDEKMGILQNAQKRLAEITRRTIADESDIDEIRDIRNRIGEVYQEYETRLNREYDGTVEFSSDKWFVEKRVDSYSQLVDKLNFTMRICAEADKLQLQSEVAEIAVRMKVNARDPMLPELYEQLNDNFNNSLVKQLRDHPEAVFRPIIDNGEKIVGDGKDLGFIDKDRDKLIQLITEKSKDTVELYSTADEKELAEQLIEEKDRSSEILMMIDEKGNQRVFVPAAHG